MADSQPEQPGRVLPIPSRRRDKPQVSCSPCRKRKCVRDCFAEWRDAEVDADTWSESDVTEDSHAKHVSAEASRLLALISAQIPLIEVVLGSLYQLYLRKSRNGWTISSNWSRQFWLTKGKDPNLHNTTAMTYWWIKLHQMLRVVLKGLKPSVQVGYQWIWGAARKRMLRAVIGQQYLTGWDILFLQQLVSCTVNKKSTD